VSSKELSDIVLLVLYVRLGNYVSGLDERINDSNHVPAICTKNAPSSRNLGGAHRATQSAALRGAISYRG
jgi:hypothetical protein